jgi:Domain of unknown function (DUF6457)
VERVERERPMRHHDDADTTLDDWADELCRELGIEPDKAARKTVLDLARVAAHTVDRPAAPLTAYLLGVAVGSGQPVAETAARIQQLARGWQKRDDTSA